MEPFTSKYKPTKKEELIGQDQAVAELEDFIKNFAKQKKKAALCYGPVGCGKTCSIYALAEDFEILEVNASDHRNAEQVETILGSASKQVSLFGTNKIILIDDVDGLSGTDDRGGLQAIIKIIEGTKFPIILTMNDPWDSKFSTLRTKCKMIQFQRMDASAIMKILENIAKNEKIEFSPEDLKILSRRSGDDIRSAINDFQQLTNKDKTLKRSDIDLLDNRDKIESILSAITKIFKTTDPMLALEAFDNINEDLDECFLWIDENLPQEYTKNNDLATAFDFLSKADVFRGRIRRWQHWRFLIYFKTLMTAGIAISKDENYRKFVKYERSKRILQIWIANQKNSKKKDLASKIGKATSCSIKKVVKDIHLYKSFLSTCANELDLSDEELSFIKEKL